MISACHADGRGSIPRQGVSFFVLKNMKERKRGRGEKEEAKERNGRVLIGRNYAELFFTSFSFLPIDISLNETTNKKIVDYFSFSY